MKTVMIFTGAEYMEIGTEYFFQHEFIKDLKLKQVTQVYYISKVATKSMEDMKKVVADGKVSIEGSERFTTEFIGKMNDGLSILEIMLKDMAGDEAGLKIINKPIRSLVNEIHDAKN